MAKAKVETRKPVERKKESNFKRVARGVCPHDEAQLGDAQAGTGDGVYRVCTKCEHKWYLNQKIHTCKCITCGVQSKGASKRKGE